MGVSRTPPAQEEVHDRGGELGEIIAFAAEDPRGDHLVEGAEEGLGAELHRQVGPDLAVSLARRDDLAEEGEVVLEPGGGEALHELRGLAQLDLEHDREVAVPAEGPQVVLGHEAQAALRVGHRPERVLHLLHVLGHEVVEEGDEDVFLVAEVEVDGAVRHPGRLRDLGHPRAEVALLGEHVHRGLQDALSLVGGAGAGHGLCCPLWRRAQYGETFPHRQGYEPGARQAARLAGMFLVPGRPRAGLANLVGIVAVLGAGCGRESDRDRLPSLSFEEVRRPAGGSVYLARAKDYSVALTGGGPIFLLPKQVRGPASAGSVARPRSAKADSVRLRLPGGDWKKGPEPGKLAGGHTARFQGSDAARWTSSAPLYVNAVYRRVYPGIDLNMHGHGRDVEMDFVVASGGDPRRIEMAFDGATAVATDAERRLVVKTPNGSLRLLEPRLYQYSGSRFGPRLGPDPKAKYVVTRDNHVRFEVSAYDPTKPLVIDPVLEYSTFFGGEDFESTTQPVATDTAGNVYVAGGTFSYDFPTTPGAYDRTCGSDGLCSTDGFEIFSDVFVSKIDASGRLVYSTFLGGDLGDNAAGVAVDPAGNAYVTGWTFSPNFPTTTGAFQRTFRPGEFEEVATDAFVAKLDPTGSALLYSTYLGGGPTLTVGNGGDIALAIATDNSGRAFVTGHTDAFDFPVTPSAYQPGPGGATDAFLTVLNPAGSALEYSTYLGGSDWDSSTGLAIDSGGKAYVTGLSLSANLPTTPGVVQGTLGGVRDAFVAKFDPAASGASSLVYSTFLGGSGYDQAQAIAVDGAGNAYVTGFTVSHDFPVKNGCQTACVECSLNEGDVFLTKLNPTASTLLYSTYFGGSGLDAGLALFADDAGMAFVAGGSRSLDFPTKSPIQAWASAKGDAVVMVFDTTASGADSLRFSTLLGGIDNDVAGGVARGLGGSIVVSGRTLSPDFPIQSATQEKYGGGLDLFVARLCLTPACLTSPRVSRRYHTVDPCRAVDTRGPAGAYGGPAVPAGSPRVFRLSGTCGVPPGAAAVSLNVTVVTPTTAGHLSVVPADSPIGVSSVNFGPGQTRANNVVVGLSESGQLVVASGQSSGTTHVLLDVNGYFQ